MKTERNISKSKNRKNISKSKNNFWKGTAESTTKYPRVAKNLLLQQSSFVLNRLLHWTTWLVPKPIIIMRIGSETHYYMSFGSETHYYMSVVPKPIKSWFRNLNRRFSILKTWWKLKRTNNFRNSKFRFFLFSRKLDYFMSTVSKIFVPSLGVVNRRIELWLRVISYVSNRRVSMVGKLIT